MAPLPAFLNRLLRRDPDALPTSVSPTRAQELLADGAVLVDVREQAEWRSGRAAGARHIPLARLSADARRLPQDKPVIVMCASGMRSRSGAAQLRSQGLKATSLSGGLAAWRSAGGRVVTR